MTISDETSVNRLVRPRKATFRSTRRQTARVGGALGAAASRRETYTRPGYTGEGHVARQGACEVLSIEQHNDAARVRDVVIGRVDDDLVPRIGQVLTRRQAGVDDPGPAGPRVRRR